MFFDFCSISKLIFALSKNILNVDKGQLEQAISHIILNARQAMIPHGKGKLFLSSKDYNGQVILTIGDNGIGIKKEVLSKVFNPFFTTKGAFAEDNYGIPGIGLGLAVVNQIIYQHKGSISIDSNPNNGTQVTVMLPCNKNG